MFDTEDTMTELFDDINKHLAQTAEKPKLLTEPEVERLITSLALKRGEEGFSEDECVSVIKWAEATRVASTMLDLVLQGDCDINWDKDDVLISITELGKDRINGSAN